ncbi:MAG: EAL domain-containing protein [Lachnospiraceae bacterium]|nr:EAL domain-containing protein [Lachnospiraceae bacterium]
MEERQKILIVEDEDVNRRIVKKILADQYDILEAENGAVAWEMISEEESNVDAILLDIVMPEMNGYAFLERIRKASMTELPVIVMTGEADNETEQKVLNAGAWDFITKPYNARVLRSRLRNAIARRQVSVYEKMQKMAAHDPLTGLHNRGRMFEKTRQMVDAHPDKTFLFLRIDIDNFSLYNAAFGEEEGDRLLCFLAQFFEQLAKEYELITFGRMNADIFCACVEYSGKRNEIQEAVDKVQQKLAEYSKNYLLEISVGIYQIDDPSLSVEEFYQRASIGTQKCKRQFGKHIGYYDEAYRKQAERDLQITNEMKNALEKKQFVVYLQPKFDLTENCACGAEALVRWKHPERGLIPPGEFIPVFEKNGFIAQLDYYVWENTCQMIKKWVDEGKNPFPVSINISRISLYNPKLVEILTGLVERYQIDYGLLQLEVTESAYMTNPELMQNTIHLLRNAGFVILMDDFGSGYSSLNTLKDIEVDILKLDMKFLPKSGAVEKGEIILASMIKMASWLGMPVVAEGVETRQQRDFLEGVGCEYVQGYFYSRPIPQAEYEAKYIYGEA